jgi:hypothetical protein
MLVDVDSQYYDVLLWTPVLWTFHVFVWNLEKNTMSSGYQITTVCPKRVLSLDEINYFCLPKLQKAVTSKLYIQYL